MLDRSLLIVSGKGGVGKSAVSAALALAAERSGRRVLAVSMVEAGGGLASHLGVGRLDFAPAEVRPGLSALVIDRTSALIEYLQVQAGIRGLMTMGPVVKAFDALASTAPAVREIVTIGKVLWEVRRGEWDLVVADGPPTGQITSYLRAARTIMELVPVGRIRDQAVWMGEILADPEETALVLVTVPEELPTEETFETLGWLERERVVAPPIVAANRVLPHLDADPASLPSGRAGVAARLHLEVAAEQAHWLATLPPDHVLPFLFGVVTPAEVAAELADVVEEWV